MINFYTHTVSSLSVFKILTLGNKLYNSPLKHVLKAS